MRGSGFEPADPLCQGPHRTKCTPCARTEPKHRGKSENFRGQHQTVQAEGKLRCPERNVSGEIPDPWERNAPKEQDFALQGGGAAGDKPGGPENTAEHREEKEHEGVPEETAV